LRQIKDAPGGVLIPAQATRVAPASQQKARTAPPVIALRDVAARPLRSLTRVNADAA
jgi:hypothetical protein